MAINEREYHLKVLEQFLHDYQEWGEDLELEKTIKYAISSLKTDEAYQLMYEGGEVFTKADMIGVLKEIQKEIEEKIQGYEARSLEHINAMYEASMSGRMFGYCEANEIVQEKIDKLKGEEDEKN